MNKKIILLVIVLLLGIIGLLVYNNTNNKIKEGYIIVFHGKENNIEYETYIYKVNNDKENAGFDFINVQKKKNKVKVIGRGTVDWTDDVFNVAKKNKAYDYVTMGDRKEKYTIEDFKPLFIMN